MPFYFPSLASRAPCTPRFPPIHELLRLSTVCPAVCFLNDHLPSGFSCCVLADIDECVTGIHNCSVNETCFNIQGGFRCLAFECPENYRRSGDT